MKHMSKFIFRSISLLLLFYTLYWCYLHYLPSYYNSATNNRWHFLKETLTTQQQYATQPILFVGDSRLNAGVDFIQIDSCFNLSAGGISPIEMYYIVKKYLTVYPAPKKIVLSQSPRFFTELFSLWKFAVRNRFFSEQELAEIFTTAAQTNDSLIGTLPEYQSLLFTLKYFEYYQPDLRASRIFFGKKRNDKMNAYMLYNKGKRPHQLHHKKSSGLNYEATMEDFSPSPLLDYYFDKLLQLCHEQAIEVHFVNMPMNASSYRKLPAPLKVKFENYLRTKNKRYPNMHFDTRLSAWPDSMFGDPSHLHSVGAKYFTDSLLIQLKLPKNMQK